MSTTSILREIREERERQLSIWTTAQDDHHRQNDWISIMARHLGLAAEDGGSSACVDRFRRQMIRVAAAAVAAVEASDRGNPGSAVTHFVADEAVNLTEDKSIGLPPDNRGPGY